MGVASGDSEDCAPGGRFTVPSNWLARFPYDVVLGVVLKNERDLGQTKFRIERMDTRWGMPFITLSIGMVTMRSTSPPRAPGTAFESGW